MSNDFANCLKDFEIKLMIKAPRYKSVESLLVMFSVVILCDPPPIRQIL